MCIIKNSLGQSHDIALKVLREGDTAVDATAGNGNDTVFLARIVGRTGRVYSFDIQEQAIINTRKKLADQNFLDRVTLIKDGHENMDKHINEKVKIVMFNLGYLPGGNHSIGTKRDTTITAIQKAIELIEFDGIVLIVVYYGGDSGFDEKEAVLEFLKSIDCKRYTVMQTEFVNQVNCPPILVCIEKTA